MTDRQKYTMEFDMLYVCRDCACPCYYGYKFLPGHDDGFYHPPSSCITGKYDYATWDRVN